MLKGIFSRTVSISGAAFIVGAFSILSRLIGLVRDRMLAGQFGATERFDIYIAAFKIPDFVYQMIVVGALSATFIPLFAKVSEKEGEDEGWRMINNVLHVLMVGLIILIGLAWVFARPLASFVAPGMSPDALNQVAVLMRSMFVAQIFLAISMIFGSVLQSMRRFFFSAFAPIMYNVGIIAGLLLFVPRIGMMGLGYGVVLGAFLHMCLQIAGMSGTGYRWNFVFKPFDKHVRYILRHMPPRTLGLIANQLMLTSMTIFASWLGEGSITIVNMAYNLNFFPVGVIGVSFAIAAFPALSFAAQTDDEESFRETLSATIKQIFFFLIPIMAITILMRAQIVRAVYGTGRFDWDATVATAQMLGIFAVSFIPQSLVYVFARAFFAKEDTFTPLSVGFGSLLLQLALSFALVPIYGLVGLGIADGVATFVQAGILWLIFRFYFLSIDDGVLLRSIGKLFIAGIFAAISLQLSKQIFGAYVRLDTWTNVAAEFAVGSFIAIGMYALSAHLMGSEDMAAFLGGLKRRILSRVRPSEVVNSASPN